MRNFIFIFALLPVLSFADPRTGDRASYNVSLKDARTTQISDLEKKLEAVDEKSKSALLTETVTALGYKPKVTRTEVALQDLQSEYSVFAECSEYGGKFEFVSVPAGMIQACAIEVDNEDEKGMAWYGLVPFGLVKKAVKLFGTNVLETTELETFEFGF